MKSRKRLLVTVCSFLLVLVIVACAGGDTPQRVPVNMITVAGEGGRATVSVGETLQMVAEVQPQNASNREVEWSLEDAGGAAARQSTRAAITAGGELSGVAPGGVIVRARAKDGSGVTGEARVDVVPQDDDPQVDTFTLTLVADPVDGGDVAGGGVFEAGDDVVVTATPDAGWVFVNWTRDGAEVSDAAGFTYSMPAEDVTLVARFVVEGPAVDPSGEWGLTVEVTQDWFEVAEGETDVTISPDLQTIEGTATIRVYDLAPAAYPQVLRLAVRAASTSLVRSALPGLRRHQVTRDAIDIPPENRVDFTYDRSGEGFFTIDLEFYIQFDGGATTHAIVDVYNLMRDPGPNQPDQLDAQFVVAIERDADNEASDRVQFAAYMVEVEGYEYWFPRDELEYRVTSTR